QKNFAAPEFNFLLMYLQVVLPLTRLARQQRPDNSSGALGRDCDLTAGKPLFEAKTPGGYPTDAQFPKRGQPHFLALASGLPLALGLRPRVRSAAASLSKSSP